MGQEMVQGEEEMEPVALVVFPEGQTKQKKEPVVVEYFPIGQSEQAVAMVEYLPTAQLVHVAEEARAAYVPAMQAMEIYATPLVADMPLMFIKMVPEEYDDPPPPPFL